MTKNQWQKSIPIIILHGWAIDIQNHNQKKWQTFIQYLEKTGLQVKFMALPGLSTSLKEAWTLTNFTKWLEEKLSKYPQVILVGHSFGGQLAIRYTAQHPKRVKRLILIDSSGIRDHSLPTVIKRRTFKVLATIGKSFTKNQALRRLLYKLAREKDYLQASPAQRKTMSNILKDEIVGDLSAIKCPTLVIWGKNDTTTPLQNAYLLNNQLKNSQLSIILQARHSPQFTHTQETAQQVLNFLHEN